MSKGKAGGTKRNHRVVTVKKGQCVCGHKRVFNKSGEVVNGNFCCKCRREIKG